MTNTNEQATPTTLESSLTHRHRLGDIEVCGYTVSCTYTSINTFDVNIGSSIHPNMQAIVADKFWGFADEFAQDSRCGAIYAVFSKADVVMAHVLSFSNDGRCVEHRVFTSDDEDQGSDFVGSGLIIVPKVSSLEGKGKDHRCLDLRILRAGDESVDATTFFNFPDQPVYGVQPTYTLDYDGVVLTLASEKNGSDTWLTVAKEGVSPKRFFSLQGGIEFLGYRIQGSYYRAMFKTPNGFGFTISPHTFAIALLVSDTSLESLLHTCTVSVGDELATSKIWLTENGQLCGRYSPPSMKEETPFSVYWLYDMEHEEWVIEEPETK